MARSRSSVRTRALLLEWSPQPPASSPAAAAAAAAPAAAAATTTAVVGAVGGATASSAAARRTVSGAAVRSAISTFNTTKRELQTFVSSADRKHKFRDLAPAWPQPMPVPPGDHKHVLERLDPNSLEYKEIDDKFHNQGTQPFDGKIARIERVVNDSLWRKYAMRMREIKAETGRLSANEVILFHGTSGMNPEVIANDGIDFRFANGGMWGRAAYAAVNARYSNSYAYTGAGNGIKQMFVVSVALGNGEQRVHDSTCGSIKKPGEGFQSVYGETGGSQVHMTYELYQVYPKYLITYR